MPGHSGTHSTQWTRITLDETNYERPSKRRRGRPRRTLTQSAANRKHDVLEKLRKHHLIVQEQENAVKERLSRLERLPVELIQQIFFLALEVNLLRASPHLGTLLATDRIFKALIIFAYYDDDWESPVEVEHFLPLTYRLLVPEAKIRLQRGITSCRWFTYEKLLLCMPALRRLAIVKAWYEEKALVESVTGNPFEYEGALSIQALEDVCESIAPLPPLSEKLQLEKHFLAWSALNPVDDLGNSKPSELTQQPLQPRIVKWQVYKNLHGHMQKDLGKQVTFLAARHIPDWLLLRSSWTQNEICLLQLLRQGYSNIEHDRSMNISQSALLDGMRTAVQHENCIVLETLLEIRSMFYKSPATQYAGSKFLTIPSTMHIPLELFHRAVQLQHSSTEVLSLLLRAAIDDLPTDDNLVTTWAVYQSRLGNALASWLLLYMEGNLHGVWNDLLFIDGALSENHLDKTDFPFPRASFAEELGYFQPSIPTARAVFLEGPS